MMGRKNVMRGEAVPTVFISTFYIGKNTGRETIHA